MISKFLQEQKRYTQNQLSELLEEKDEKRLISIIRRLREYGILKLVKNSEEQKNMTDLLEEDIENVDVEFRENDYFYVFTFVGIINISGKILKCFPKYIFSNNKPLEELKQILKVLEKINSKEQIISIFNGDKEENSFNLLALQLYLLNDYYENGIYTNSDTIIETNGTGEIFWDRTISETFALLNDNKPYYTDFKTRKNVENDRDYFKKLHEVILSKISKELEDADLLEIFEITEVELSNEELSELGENDYILYRIERELNTQFNTRKQLLLKAMYTYINQNGHLYDLESFSMFGTNNFNIVWEKVCADVFDNKLNISLANIELPKKLAQKYNKNDRLKDIIEKPLWSVPNNRSKDTLIPDLISCYKKDGEYYFVIFDAKYYNTVLEEGGVLRGVPGIESITKQYLYQLAYKDFIELHGIKNVRNCFLMPTEKDEIINKGYVSLDMLSSIGLQNIQVRMLPAKKVFDLYLKGKKLNDISKLKLDNCQNELPIHYGDNFIKYENMNTDIYRNKKVAEDDEKYLLENTDIFRQNIGKFKTENGRNIYYYGEEFGNDIIAINNKCHNIKHLNDLFFYLLKCWNKDTVYSIFKDNYSKQNNPSQGQSEITAMIVFDLFGGTIHKIKIDKEVCHFFNKINGHYIDLTRDQFEVGNIEISYQNCQLVERQSCNENKETLLRYIKLTEKLNEIN